MFGAVMDGATSSPKRPGHQWVSGFSRRNSDEHFTLEVSPKTGQQQSFALKFEKLKGM